MERNSFIVLHVLKIIAKSASIRPSKKCLRKNLSLKKGLKKSKKNLSPKKGLKKSRKLNMITFAAKSTRWIV